MGGGKAEWRGGEVDQEVNFLWGGGTYGRLTMWRPDGRLRDMKGMRSGGFGRWLWAE